MRTLLIYRREATLYTRGFSTVEMMIAMAVMILVLAAVVLLSFGSQSLLADSQGNAEALSLAQLMLEAQESLARNKFVGDVQHEGQDDDQAHAATGGFDALFHFFQLIGEDVTGAQERASPQNCARAVVQ